MFLFGNLSLILTTHIPFCNLPLIVFSFEKMTLSSPPLPNRRLMPPESGWCILHLRWSLLEYRSFSPTTYMLFLNLPLLYFLLKQVAFVLSPPLLYAQWGDGCPQVGLVHFTLKIEYRFFSPNNPHAIKG